jgi:hypothetical protein
MLSVCESMFMIEKIFCYFEPIRWLNMNVNLIDYALDSVFRG